MEGKDVDDTATGFRKKVGLGDELQVSSLTVPELKDELKRRRLETSGNRSTLVHRLENAILQDVAPRRQDDYFEEEDDALAFVEGQAGVSYPSDVASKTILTFRDVDESLSTFSGDDGKNVTKWITEFQEMAALCGWSDIHKVVYAKRLLRGSAKLFVNYENCCKSWITLQYALKSEFSKKVNSRQVHQELSRRRKKVSETYHEYMYKMMEISSQIDMEIEAVIQYIIAGIEDDEINKVVLYGAQSIKELRSKLDIYEAMKKNMNSKSKPKSYERNVKRMDYSFQGNIRCFNCGARDHLSKHCPDKAKGVKCFKCNKYGHVASQCPNDYGHEKNQSNFVEKDFKQKSIKEIKLNGRTLVALFDSGSDLTLIGADEYVRIGAPMLHADCINFHGVGIKNNSTLGSFDTYITVDDTAYMVKIHVVPSAFITCQLLLGADFLQQVDVKLNQGVVVQVLKSGPNLLEDIPDVFTIDVCDEPAEMDISYLGNAKLGRELVAMIQSYKPQKSLETCVKMSIILKDEMPVYQRPRRLSACEKLEVNKLIQIWLDEGIIKESKSEYASPIVLVKKKDGSTRLCVDYRQLNKKVLKDRYPLPLIEDQLDRLEGACLFSTLDLKNGFFHVPIEERSQKYTAFVTPDGHYEFLRAPFGFCNSPSVFQKFINAVFKDLITDGTVITYMDDLVIPSVDLESGLIKLRRVLETASKHGLEINWKKCQLLKNEIEYLGHVVRQEGISPSVRKVISVVKFPRPTNVKSVQSFIGLTGYFRKFIPNYSLIAKPLTNLLRDDVKFKFEKEEEEAFSMLKLKLTKHPVLKLYRYNAETELHTDASSVGFGAVLMQRDEQDESFHPVYFASGKTTPAEEKYTSYELEVLAIVKALRKFRVYLLGIPFKIITDCKAFEMTMKKKDLCVRVARWALLLEEFNYIVEHRPGKNMKHVDALSRYPLRSVMLVNESDDGLNEKFKKAQKEDVEINKILLGVLKGQNSNFAIKNGLLYKEVNDELVLVVPKRMQTDIIKEAHSRGHFAVLKTEALVKRDYWFKNMRARIEQVIKNCINCIIAERKCGKQEGMLNPIDKGERPFDTYHIDHLGHLASTKKRYQNIFVVVDAFTKFVWLYPTKSTGSEEVINHLKKQAAVFGNPKRIISDRGSAFTSHAFENYCKDEKIEIIRITTGIPRSNGQVERVNRTVISLLTKLTAPRPEEWYKFIDVAMQYLNATFNRSIKRTPFELMVGTQMHLKDNPEIRKMIEEENILIFEDERDNIRMEARENIQIIQEENKKGFNNKRKQATKYKEDDIVAIRRTQLKPNSKLSPKFLGPYRIKSVFRNDRYAVERIGNHEGPINTTSTADSMKPWTVDNDDLGDDDLQSFDGNIEDDV